MAAQSENIYSLLRKSVLLLSHLFVHVIEAITFRYNPFQKSTTSI